jgi:hypothetical protein
LNGEKNTENNFYGAAISHARCKPVLQSMEIKKSGWAHQSLAVSLYRAVKEIVLTGNPIISRMIS